MLAVLLPDRTHATLCALLPHLIGAHHLLVRFAHSAWALYVITMRRVGVRRLRKALMHGVVQAPFSRLAHEDGDYF